MSPQWTETLIGTTTYDLQSNASVDNRITYDIMMELFLQHGQ